MTKIIPVDPPLQGHGGTLIREIVIRPPLAGEFWENGEPVEVGKAPNGSLFRIERPEVLKAYIRLLVVEPKDPLLLNQAPIGLARKIKDTIEGFFRDDSGDSEGSKTSQTSSSSSGSVTSGSPQPLSIG